MYNILEELLKERGITAYRLAKETGISTATLTNWKKGNYVPKQDKLQKIADYFNVTLDYLMTGEASKTSMLPDGAIPLDMSMFIKLPIIGSVHCGEPMFEESNIEGYEYASIEDLRKNETYFYLRAKGDSMINAGINEGDLLLIRVQSDVDSGDIAIVNVNGDEETLKRIIKKDNAVILQPENPAYETKIFLDKEINLLRIQGRLMKVIKKY